MIERAALVIGLGILIVLLSLAAREIARKRVAGTAGRTLPQELRAQFPDLGPGIVYLYGPHCGTCRQQAAVLDRLSTEDGVPVVRIDATSHPALTDTFRIMSVPATLVVDSRQTVRSVNLGLRSHDALAGQLREIAGFPGSG